MGNIRRPSDSGSRGTNTTAFIQCINGREPSNKQTMMSGFGQDMPRGSSYSVCRYPGWNHQRVCHQLTC